MFLDYWPKNSRVVSRPCFTFGVVSRMSRSYFLRFARYARFGGGLGAEGSRDIWDYDDNCQLGVSSTRQNCFVVRRRVQHPEAWARISQIIFFFRVWVCRFPAITHSLDAICYFLKTRPFFSPEDGATLADERHAQCHAVGEQNRTKQNRTAQNAMKPPHFVMVFYTLSKACQRHVVHWCIWSIWCDGVRCKWPAPCLPAPDWGRKR